MKIRPMLVTALVVVVATIGLAKAPNSEDSGLATCHGNHPCKACSNCSKCDYCHKKGGYCGVCSKPARPD